MKRRRVAEDTRVFSDVISNGLYIVFEWIAQRRREAIEQLRQYNENMLKSMSLALRRIRMSRYGSEAVLSYTPFEEVSQSLVGPVEVRRGPTPPDHW